MATDPDGKPYTHNDEQAEAHKLAHKLARAEGDGPVSNETARAYLNAFPADKTAMESDIAALRAAIAAHLSSPNGSDQPPARG